MAEYSYSSTAPSHDAGALMEAVLGCLQTTPSIVDVLDAGCGNGVMARYLVQAGYRVSGVDDSPSGIQYASAGSESGDFKVASVYDDLAELFGRQFDAIVSTEVIEHLYDPRLFLRRLNAAVKPGGLVVLSTPYHGYLKNLALALTGKMDAHFTALWDGGHIKFWSFHTLGTVLHEQGFAVKRRLGTGRIPFLWKSMVVAAVKLQP